jgi:hypothetical protein
LLLILRFYCFNYYGFAILLKLKAKVADLVLLNPKPSCFGI